MLDAPRREKLEDFDVVLMCDHELWARLQRRPAREIFGGDAVVGASRTRLTRKTTDCLICVKSMLGAAGVLREFYAEEPHGMAKAKRTFAFPGRRRRRDEAASRTCVRTWGRKPWRRGWSERWTR